MSPLHVICLVYLQVAGNGLSTRLEGWEVKELTADYSLVDFSAAIRAKHLQVEEPMVKRINMNDCNYLHTPEQVEAIYDRQR
jgi:hypothetical protein